MLKRIVLLGSLKACIACMQAQPVFEKIYSGASGRFDLIELTSRNIVVPMAFSNTINVSGTSILDPSGQILATHCYAVDTLLVLQSVKNFGDNTFYFAGGYYKGTCAIDIHERNTYPVLAKMDSLGNRSDLVYYVLNGGACFQAADDLMITSDGSPIIWGLGTRFFMLKADPDLNVMWAKRVDRHGGFRFIKELPGGDLLAGFDMDTAGACVARLDASGNFLWCKSYLRPMGRAHDAVIESDSSFIVTGYTGSTPQKLFMMELDGEGEVQWCRGYDNGTDAWASLYPSCIVPTLDGKLVLLGTLGQSQFPYFYRPILMKTDRNGDTLWTRSTGADDYIYYTADLLASSDGGFLFDGGVWGDLPDGNSGLPYIFKADSLGHFSCWEHEHPVEVLDLFPTDSSFTLTSVDGAVRMPAFANDTIFDPIRIYDGCTFTTNTLQLLPHTRQVKVRPNPTTGRFTVEFDDPLVADSFYSVYDPMGRLLYQRPLAAGKQMDEIDLSRFSKGTYLIKFTDREGVCYERVVVE